MSTIDEIEERLSHEPCCDHTGRDEHGCWDCYNTGHAHIAYVIEGRAREDMERLMTFAAGVRRAYSDPDYYKTLDRQLGLLLLALEER